MAFLLVDLTVPSRILVADRSLDREEALLGGRRASRLEDRQDRHEEASSGLVRRSLQVRPSCHRRTGRVPSLVVLD